MRIQVSYASLAISKRPVFQQLHAKNFTKLSKKNDMKLIAKF